MKRFLSFATVVAMIFGAASCQREVVPGQKGDCKVSFKVEIPEDVVTKAHMSDGSTVDELVWEAYVGDTRVCNDTVTVVTMNGEGKRQFFLEISLVANVTYDFLFWAQKSGTDYYNTEDLTNVSVNYADGNKLANDEMRDAFYATAENIVADGGTRTVYLTRPFAQINFATSPADWESASHFISDVGLKSQMTLTNVPTNFSVKDGSVSGSDTVTFDYSLCPASETAYENNYIRYGSVDYPWVAMNYIFAPADRSTMDEVTAAFVHKQNTPENALSKIAYNVPFRQNYRTNILGDIFTGGNKFYIVIEPGFVNSDIENYPDYVIAEPLRNVIQHGGTFVMTEDLTVSEVFTTDKKVIIDLNGKTLRCTSDDIMFRLDADAELTFIGNGKVHTEGYVASARSGAKVTVKGGEYSTGDCTLFQADGGQVFIEGGLFESHPYDGIYYTLNHIDSKVNEGLIEVTGGAFHFYNPAASYTEPSQPMSFVPDGYESVDVWRDGEWFEVKKK